MKKTAWRISKKAVEDLENIWFYTFENWSKEQADRYYNLLLDEIEFIAKNYTSGKPQDHIKSGYRMAKVKSHLIFYRKLNDNNVEIIRILHQRMDVENRLGE